MAISVDDFREKLIESGLISNDELGTLCGQQAEPPKTATDLAGFLIQSGRLTRFQAQKVAAGQGKGLVLDRYILKDKIGKGGMGEVYLAVHRRMEREVALKILPADLVTNSEMVERFHREVKAAAKLSHPNIVAAYDATEKNGIHFLVMERIHGDTLQSWVEQNGVMSVDSALRIVRQTARGLEYAHAQGIIHRDIKPSNLLIDKKRTVKILDMGLARITSESDETGLTNTGMVMGTVDYMAPEQAVDTRSADARSDLYSLGCSLFYLLTGQPSLVGDSLTQKLLSLQNDPPFKLADYRADVSTDLESLYQKMVAKDPAVRFQSAAEVVRAVEICLTKTGSHLNTEATSNNQHRSDQRSLEQPTRSFPQSNETGEHSTIAQKGPTSKILNHPAANFIQPDNSTTETASIIPNRIPLKKAGQDRFTKGKSIYFGFGIGAVAILVVLVVFLNGRSGDNSPDATPPGEANDARRRISQADKFIAKEPDDNSPKTNSRNSTEQLDGKKNLNDQAVEQKTVSKPESTNFALSFDGLRDIVIVNDFHYPRSEPFTFEAKLKYLPPPGLVTQGQSLVTGHGSILLGPNNHLSAMLWNPDANRAVTRVSDTKPMKANRTYHVAVTWDKKFYRLFVDGILVDQKSLSSIPAFEKVFWFGIGGHVSRQVGEENLCFPGEIDDVRISKVARYNKDFEPERRPRSDENTLALYYFNEGEGKVAKDSSGNGNDGKIKGAKWVKVDH